MMRSDRSRASTFRHSSHRDNYHGMPHSDKARFSHDPKSRCCLRVVRRFEPVPDAKQSLTELLSHWTDVLLRARATPPVTPTRPWPASRRTGDSTPSAETRALGTTGHRTDATPDRSLANGSSIAFVLEIGRKKVLFGGDAHADVLVNSIDHYVPHDRKLKLKAIKVPHHGSLANMSIPLLNRLDCKNFLILSNGSFFDHPDKMCIQQIVDHVEKPHLWFNYATPQNGVWLTARTRHSTSHCPAGIAFDGRRILGIVRTTAWTERRGSTDGPGRIGGLSVTPGRTVWVP